MVRRQTRAQKRNRRQKTKRNNRRQNKTLRRKRQSRRKGGSSTENNGQESMTEEFIQREARILNITVEQFKEYKELGLYKNSEYTDEFMKQHYGDFLQMSVYRVLARKYQKKLKEEGVDIILSTKKFIRAIDEANLLGMDIIDFLKDDKNLALNPLLYYTSSLHKEKREDLNNMNPKLNLVKKPDGYKKIKDEAKILGITIDEYIGIYKEANSKSNLKPDEYKKKAKILGITIDKYIDLYKGAKLVDDLIRKVDEKNNKDLEINNEAKYVEMKKDAKETGLTLSEVKEAINKAQEEGKHKKIVFAEKMNMPFFDNEKWKKLLSEKRINNFKMPNLNTLRINYDDHIAKQRENYEYEAFEKKQKGYASSIARSPSSSTGSSEATTLATSVPMF